MHRYISCFGRDFFRGFPEFLSFFVTPQLQFCLFTLKGLIVQVLPGIFTVVTQILFYSDKLIFYPYIY